MPVFYTTNIEQYVANLSVFVVHYGILVFLINQLRTNSYYEIELFWRYVVKILGLRLL